MQNFEALLQSIIDNFKSIIRRLKPRIAKKQENRALLQAVRNYCTEPLHAYT